MPREIDNRTSMKRSIKRDYINDEYEYDNETIWNKLSNKFESPFLAGPNSYFTGELLDYTKKESNPLDPTGKNKN